MVFFVFLCVLILQLLPVDGTYSWGRLGKWRRRLYCACDRKRSSWLVRRFTRRRLSLAGAKPPLRLMLRWKSPLWIMGQWVLLAGWLLLDNCKRKKVLKRLSVAANSNPSSHSCGQWSFTPSYGISVTYHQPQVNMPCLNSNKAYLPAPDGWKAGWLWSMHL